MFVTTSRYYYLETANHTTEDGRAVAYKRRRFLPRGETMLTLAEVVVTNGDRLDRITARTIGNPQHFWRICDRENAMNPRDVLAEAGDVDRADTTDSQNVMIKAGEILHVPVPQAGS